MRPTFDYFIPPEYQGKSVKVPPRDMTHQMELLDYNELREQVFGYIKNIKKHLKEIYPSPDPKIILKIPEEAGYLDIQIIYEEDDDSGIQEETTSQILRYYSEYNELIDTQDLYNIEMTGILDKRLEQIFYKLF
ncbi:MAG: hypothetical protein KAT28_04995 [Candidatus Aenigmarchaeota archaeon]|nr:hypothetical protein [Candidatus Aenigmarchaeota archaeon]